MRGTLYAKAVLVAVAALAIGLLYLRLAAGPLSFSGLPERVAAALGERIGPGWTVSLKDSAVELQQGSLALRTVELDIRDPSGALVVRSPNAIVSVDTLSLLTATLQPRSIELRDLQLRATISRDGSLSFAPAGEPPEVPISSAPVRPPPEPAPPELAPAGEAQVMPSTVSGGVASLFDLILEPSGIVGALDRAAIANARLTLVDADGRERAVFSRVDAAFERSDKGRRFDMQLDGPRGAWWLSGEVGGDRRHREGVLRASDVPVQDLIVLGGLSNVPGTTDVKVSGSVDAALIRRSISRFDVRLDASPGTVTVADPDMPPIGVDAASADASWDESRRTLVVKSLTFRREATSVALQGEFVTGVEEGWRLALSGKDAVVSGPTPAEQPFRLDTIDAKLAGAGGGVALKSLAVRGPAVAVEMAGTLHGPDDEGGLHVQGQVSGTGAREALRLWPNNMAHNVRDYLVANLRAGTLDRLAITIAMSGPVLATAMKSQPIPDNAVKAEFAVANADIVVAEGMPPLTRAEITGVVTGTTAALRARAGRVEMPDGRALSFLDASFRVPDAWSRDGLARIAFRLEGGADALASFLQSPALSSVAGLDLDPANLKGRADVRVALPLTLRNIPSLPDLPVTITGGITELSIDKVFGKDRLEGASLSVSYDKGSLAMTGGGKVGPSPATLEVRQPRDGPGEVVVGMVLDEQARARKGLTFGPRLTGPVPIRVVLPLGAKRPGTRIEADLTKAAVDDLIPGWVKPAGRPGRLSFILVEEKGFEMREVQLESGPVQLRGSAKLSAEGNLERADLPSFKLSQGDDLRVQLERSPVGFKVTARGNVADARPFLKGLAPGAGPSPGQGKRKKQAAPEHGDKDVDLELAVNILTGFNDEAMTNASLKASVRGSELRQLQLGGKFAGAVVSAQTIAQRGAPVVVLESQDAGAMLRFLDIYRRMVRGDLSLQVALGQGVQVGALSIQNFALRAEPALRRIIPAQVAEQGSRIDLNDVPFTRARMDFTRTAGHLAFREASIVGREIGFTLSGSLDVPRDVADIEGTFVPAFGLNNAFAQVPLFGPLLGGGRNEGLFAVNFRLSGQLSAPTLTVNPLSAIAPGFLRKLFGVGSSADEAARAALPPTTDR